MTQRDKHREFVYMLFTLFVVVAFLSGLFAINWHMRGKCLEDGGTWIMQHWVCAGADRP